MEPVGFQWRFVPGTVGVYVMAPRANWKGNLKLSLVSCGVALFPATSTSQRIRFNIINRRTGNRVRYQQVDSETAEDVPEEDCVKGCKVADGSYVLMKDGGPDKLRWKARTPSANVSSARAE
jgi:DNA end-binding protein Ku